MTDTPPAFGEWNMEKRDGSASGDDAGRPQVQDGAMKTVWNAAIDAAAAAVTSQAPQPCDCIKLIDDRWWGHYCDCRNGGDTDRAMAWCESMNNATTILGLKRS